MGKRIIRKRNKPAGGISSSVDATDFSGVIEDTGSGELQPVAGDSSEPVADETDSGFSDPESYAGSGDRSTGTDPGTDNGTGKRRGRRKGTKNRTSEKTQTSVTTRLLFSIHAMGASFLKMPYLQLTEQESQALAVAILRVQEEYEMFTLTPKQEAWIQLVIAAGAIYGPRVVMAMTIEKMKKQHLVEQNRAAQMGPQIVEMPDVEAIKRAQNEAQTSH